MIQSLRRGMVWLVLLLLVGGTAVLAQDAPGAVEDAAFELEVIRLTNLERTSRGLTPLQRNGDLTTAARLHNQDMIDNDFFSHTGSDGSSPAERACRQGFAPYGWGDCYVGENIGAGYTTPASVVQGWMDSPGHRDNILNPDYREIGVGHTYDSVSRWKHYWTMMLGAQPQVLPAFINDDAQETTSRQVTVTLTSETVSSWGSIGAITGVKLSEDPAFAGASWQNWAQEIDFTLSAGNGTKTVYVRYTDGATEVDSSDEIVLNEPHPVLSVSPTAVTFLAQQGSSQTAPAAFTLQIRNDGGDTLNWTAGDDAAWLLLSSASGVAPADVAASVDSSGGVLGTLGTKTATVTVTATNPDAINTPQDVAVKLLVVDEIQDLYLPVVLR